MEKDSHIKLVLKEMRVNLRIGLLPGEKGAAQPVVVNAALYTKAGDYLKDVNADSIINYAPMFEIVRGWQEREHTELIESYINEFLDVSFKDPRIEACRVSILKAEICEEAEGVGVEVFMKREDWQKS